MNESDAERVALIAESEHLSQEAAERVWRASQHVAPDHLSIKVERIRKLALEQNMRKHYRGVDNKSKAAGE